MNNQTTPHNFIFLTVFIPLSSDHKIDSAGYTGMTTNYRNMARLVYVKRARIRPCRCVCYQMQLLVGPRLLAATWRNPKRQRNEKYIIRIFSIRLHEIREHGKPGRRAAISGYARKESRVTVASTLLLVETARPDEWGQLGRSLGARTSKSTRGPVKSARS